jgi:hypothetical protein
MVVGHIRASTCVVVKKGRAGRGKQPWFFEALHVGQRHTSGPKVGRNQTSFRGPDMCMPYPRPTSGCSTTIPSDSCPPLHLSPLSITSLAPLSFPHTCPPLTVPPVASPLLISCHLCHLSSCLCHPHSFFPASVSPPPGHRTPSSLSLCQSSRQTLIHVRCLAIPAGIQLSSKWKNAEAATSHRCSADSGLFYPDEAVIKVGWWWLNIFSTIKGKHKKGLSVSTVCQEACRCKCL